MNRTSRNPCSHLASKLALLLVMGLGCGAAQAAVTQGQYDALLAGGLKAVALPCKYPNVSEPTTREAAEALHKAGSEFGSCLKEHDGRRQRWYDMAEVSDKVSASKMSQAQIDDYRAALKAFIQEDVDKNRRMISTTFGDVDRALTAYVIKSKPDAPASYYNPIVARLERYDYGCEVPSLPRYIDSRSEARAVHAKVQAWFDCDNAWLEPANAATKEGFKHLVSEAELARMSYAQGKSLFDKFIAAQAGIQTRYKIRVREAEELNDAEEAMFARTADRQATRDAEAQDLEDFKATAAATRKAIRDAGNAAMGNTGRFVPLQIPKRPGQP